MIETAALTTDQWSAIGDVAGGVGAVGTLVVAFVAAVYARRQVEAAKGQVASAQAQVEEARRLREEQAQPFVIADFQPSVVWGGIIELVIKNTGSTLARDVRLEFTPPLQSTLIEKRRVKLPESPLLRDGIPTLPPGREYRLLFERGPDLYEREDLPRRYDVVATFEDSQGHKHRLPYVLDLNVLFGWSYVDVYTVHHVAKHLDRIEKTMRKWTRHGSGLRAWVRDEDAYNFEERWQEEHGGEAPYIGNPFPAGRRAPSRFDRLREPLPVRLYWRWRRRRHVSDHPGPE